MSDKLSASIEIGGKVSRTQISTYDPEMTVVQALMSVIGSEGVSLEFGDAHVDPETESDLLGYRDEDDLHLRFRDDQACNGEFDELEAFCREHGIAYRRWSACGEYLGEDVYYDPGMTKPIVLLCNDDGAEQVSGAEVREVLAIIDRDWDVQCKNKNGPVQDQEQDRSMSPNDAIRKLRDLVPDTIPALMPKFEIIS